MTHGEVARTAQLVREINRTHAMVVVDHDMQFVKMIAARLPSCTRAPCWSRTPWIRS
jgi:ABC-type uncharacterized transport system ATPase subunit